MRVDLTRKAALPLLLGVLLVAFALRVHCLECQSLWLDEVASAYRTTLAAPELLLDTADNLHVPGYFAALTGWTGLAGRSEFSLRYFTVLGGLLLVPLLYRSSILIFRDRTAGMVAAAMAALSPAHHFYSQETRMYALMPALYLAILTMVLAPGRLQHRRDWILLAVLEIVALYMHLFGVLAIVAANVLLLVRLRRSDIKRWRAWLASQVTVVLAFVPWLWLVWRWGGAVPANLGNTRANEAVVSVVDYLRLIWVFLNTGQTVLDLPHVTWSGYLAALLLFGLPVALVLERHRGRLLLLGAGLALPLAGAYAVWRFDPLTHPRYLIFLLAPLFLILGLTVARLLERRRAAVLGVAIAALVLAVDVSALSAAASEERLQRYDARRLSRELAQRSEPGDVVLMPPNDHSLWYYDPAPAEVLNWPFAGGDQAQRAEQLAELMAGAEGATLVQYRDLYSYDQQGQIPYLLEANGHLEQQFSVQRMDVSAYDLTPPWSTPALAPGSQACGPLALTGLTYPAENAPGDGLAVSVRWQLQEAVAEPLVASMRLLDGERELAAQDRLLENEAGESTEAWDVDQEATSYFVLAPPLGAPPLTYVLGVVLYVEGGRMLECGTDGGQHLALGTVTRLPGDRRTEDAYGSWSGVQWQTPAETALAPGLTLEGYHVRPQRLHPGDTAHVTLRWRSDGTVQGDYEPLLVLKDGEAILEQAAGSLFQRYPSQAWQEERIIETRQLTVPPSLARMKLALQAGEESISLGPLSIATEDLLWEVPAQAESVCARMTGVGTLRGYEWESGAVDKGGRLTLYWQAGDDAPAATSWTVFTHLLEANGALITQHDGLPSGGRRPTTTWLPDEVIRDEHVLQAGAELTGTARLSVGLYDLSTGERATATTCDGQRLANDAVSLDEVELE